MKKITLFVIVLLLVVSVFLTACTTPDPGVKPHNEWMQKVESVEIDATKPADLGAQQEKTDG